MDVFFNDSKFESQMRTNKSRRKTFGPERTKKIEIRWAQLDAAGTLADLRHLPGHWHELTGDWAGHLAASLDGPYRLILAPTTTPKLPDSSLDWGAVTGVVLIGITDYH